MLIRNSADHPHNVASSHGLTMPQASTMREAGAVKTRQVDRVAQTGAVSGDQALADAVKKINDFIAPALQSVEFAIDQESGRLVVKVVDTATQKVLRQMPSEVALNIARTLDDVKGLIVSLEA